MAMVCNLSTLMGTKRYSIEDVHRLTGLSRSTVSALYNNKATRIDYATAEKLCALFQCEVGTLLSIQEQHNNASEKERI